MDYNAQSRGSFNIENYADWKAGTPCRSITRYCQILQRNGLIKCGSRRAGSRFYRDYPDDALERLTLIKQAKSAGFTLREVKYFFDLYGSDVDAIPLDEQKNIINAKLSEIENRLRQLKTIKNYLLAQSKEIA